jgi:Spy/CpxP family protein refolding chaperone
MNTHVGWLIPRNTRTVACTAVLGLAAALGCAGAAAQADAARMSDPNARRTELRSMVRQPQQGATTSGKAAELRHLSAEERSQLRRQLTRELRAQNAAVADASRP